MDKHTTRFEEKFIPEPNTGCWIWMVGANKQGYGLFWADGRPTRAHRFAYAKYVGPIPDGLHVLHRCDVPSCVNPAHLFLGTNADNVADREIKGRGNPPYGERHGSRTRPERTPRGDRNGSRTKPERRPRGERHGSRTKPERLARGERHGSYTQPERVARGERNGSRTHPERLARGAHNGSARLSEADVVAIRSETGVSQRWLATKYKVSQSVIGNIRRGETWRHLL